MLVLFFVLIRGKFIKYDIRPKLSLRLEPRVPPGVSFDMYLRSAPQLQGEQFNHMFFVNERFTSENSEEDIRPLLYFTDCRFESCNSLENGGAMYVNEEAPAGDLILTRCLFMNCHASSDGGAFYIFISHYVIQDSCFTNCTAKSNQCGKLKSPTAGECELNLTVIRHCQGINARDKNVISLFSRFVTVDYMNISYNHASRGNGGIYAQIPEIGGMKFCDFRGNIGSTIIDISAPSEKIVLELIILVNNKGNNRWKGLIHTEYELVFDRFYFLANTPPLYYTTSEPGVTFRKCVFDEEFSKKLFNGSFTIMGCDFDVRSPVLPFIDGFRSEACIKETFPDEERGEPMGSGWWLFGIAVLVGSWVWRKKKGNEQTLDEDEEVPLIRGRSVVVF
jgi:hypothetical protein